MDDRKTNDRKTNDKNMLLLGVLVLVIFAGCTSSQSTSQSTISTNGEIVDTNPANTGNVVEINMEAWQWGFSPGEIRVKEGDTVRISATSRDVSHGISIPEFGFNLNIYPGQTTTGEFLAVKKGTYTFSCSVYCGEGHAGQRGVLIVE